MDLQLNGKKAIVTGGSEGIGKAIALGLAQEGVDVAICARRKEPLEAAAKEIADATGRNIVPITADLTDTEQANAFIDGAVEALGGVDILVNNAGLTRDQLAMRMKDEDWQLVLDVNLTAAFRLSRACLRGMMKARFGRIIGITSVVGATGNAGQTNYAASKAGMIGMSKSLAQEVASRGITVNCVAPGFIETPMTDVLSDDLKTKLLTGIPTGRLGHVDDIASACVYLASDEASYMTGQTLHVNGGMAML